MLVSIVIPAFRSAGHITHALDSVFAQTFTNYEILVVNDGSPNTDLLEQALLPYQKRIRYLKQPNRGPSAARNNGIQQAKGDYVAFLDSDDVWFSGHLAKHLAILTKNRWLGLVYSDSILTREGVTIGHAFGQQPQHPPVSFESLLVEDCAMITSSVVVSRGALIDAGLFDERFSRCEDFDLWLRMAFRGIGMDYCSNPTLYHRVSPDGLSSNRYLMKRALIDVYNKIASTLPLSRSQQTLVQECIRRAETASQLDLLKQHLASAEYALALEAADRAQTRVRSHKLNLAIVGLRLRTLVAYLQSVASPSARNLKRLGPRAELTFNEPEVASMRDDTADQAIPATK